MLKISSEFPIEECKLLFCLIVDALLLLLIWLFRDLGQRRQRWLASRGWLMLLRGSDSGRPYFREL
jgi:hypothetical protein